ncbi:unnamed protein product [Eruca vesicaria subsp. sativa]|uniref:NUC153 domain-containing protein n=1 Tax=Eruca vesicaria subsp. sativa TaxID=29727 RepID=A0ABC8M752_ERUVS|nr:unnamed protein product [Eruca vesicaria subsp. sativa]
MASYGDKLKATTINGVKLYHVSSAPNVASWLNPKKQRALRKNPHYMQRVELIEDLKFQTASTRIKVTPDGEYLVASGKMSSRVLNGTGIHPPMVKVYELSQLALKFERHLDSEIVDFEILDNDYSKLAFLCADRSINLHAKYGKHHSLRIPRYFSFCWYVRYICGLGLKAHILFGRMGRDMTYDNCSCDLLCAASSPDLYRINMEQGRFLSPLSTQSPALNVVSRSNIHGLIACGGEDGAVECFDMRMKSCAARINAVAHGGDAAAEEMEETGETTIYDNYKFVTKEDLEKLQLTHLIGTELLKAQMHGYFMKHDLYKKALPVVKPSAQKKLEAELSQRITKKISLPKVNRDLAATIHNKEDAEEDEEAAKKVPKKKKPGLSVEDFSGGRFNNMFHNPDFQIDPESYEYRVLHPVASSIKKPSLLDEHFDAVTDDDENNGSDVSQGSDDEAEDGRPNKRSKTPKLFEVKDERHAEAFHNRRSLAKEDSLTMGERVKAMENQRGNFGASKDVKFGPGGSREMSFNARSSSTYKEDRDDEDGDGQRNKRRG